MKAHDGDMTSINDILAAAPAGIARPQVAGLVGAQYMRDPELKHHQGIMRHWGWQLQRTLGQLRSQLRSYGGAVGRGRPPVGYFGALTKFVTGTGWMSGFLPSDWALAVAPVNRKPQNRTFHHNSIFYRTQPQLCLLSILRGD